MTAHYDELETRDPSARAAAQFAQLREQIARAQQDVPVWREILAGVDASAVTGRDALARLPVTRKSSLQERQRAGMAQGDALGGFSAIGWRSLVRPRQARRVFQSPGPIYEPEGPGVDWWRMARALHAAGFRAGDLVHNSFSHHLTPAGSIMDTGAHALGCTTFAGGTGNTELQLQAMQELRPDGYVGTPSFLRILAERADEAGTPLPSTLRHALLTGEAVPRALCDALAARGIAAYQCYATAELGLIAYETEAREGLVVDEGVIVEIVRPGTGDPVPDGDVGEVVVSSLNADAPMVRLGTGDLSAVLPGPCASGRTAPRIRGWLGRADQTTKVRGMFVHPSHVAELQRRHPEVKRARLVVSGEMADDRMVLKVEVDPAGDGALATRLAETLRDLTKLRGEIEPCAIGTLPNDGKVIADERKLD